MSESLSESYVPQWLYLTEFMGALRGSDESEKKDAILLLIRDRLVFDGKFDEKHFRFLAGKPSIVDASWLADLDHKNVDWQASSIIAPGDSGLPGDLGPPRPYLIEIATSALSLFGSRTSAKASLMRARRFGPETARALKAIKAIYDTIPPQDEVSTPVLDKTVNKYLKQQNLEPVKRDAIQRATGRRR
jgi:hypothetical protein